MPKVKTTQTIAVPTRDPDGAVGTSLTVINSAAIEAVRSSAQFEHAIIAESRSVTITDAQSYQAADIVLVKIRTARKNIATVIEDKIGSIIKPIRKGLDKLYAVQRELTKDLDGPLEVAEKTVKGRMAAWQGEQARLREQERIRQLQTQPQQSLHEFAEPFVKPIDLTLASGPVKAAGSKVVTTKKWRVTDLSVLIAAVVKGDVPEIVLTVNEEVMQAYFESDREIMMNWPGVEIYDHTSIAGR